MKRLLVILLLALGAHAQTTVKGITLKGVSITTGTAAAPTFSPAAGAVSNPTTVTASSWSGCSSYIYLDTSNPPTTKQTTYSVTTAVTLYSYVHGCPGYADSSVSSAAYTIVSHVFTVVQTKTCQSVTGTTFTCAFSQGTASGNVVLLGFYGQTYTLSSVSGGTLTTFPALNSEDAQMAVITGLAANTTTITFTPSNQYATYSIYMAEVHGVNSTTPLESAAQAGMTYAYAAPTGTGSVTTTGANDEIVGVLYCGTATSLAAGSGYTSAIETNSGTGAPFLLLYSTSIESAGTYNPAVTTSGANTCYYGTGALILN